MPSPTLRPHALMALALRSTLEDLALAYAWGSVCFTAWDDMLERSARTLRPDATPRRSGGPPPAWQDIAAHPLGELAARARLQRVYSTSMQLTINNPRGRVKTITNVTGNTRLNRALPYVSPQRHQ